MKAGTVYIDVLPRMSAFVAGVQKGISGTAASLTSAGKKLSTRLTLPILGAAAAAVKLSIDFEDSMSKISGLVGVNQKQVDVWSEQILDLSKTLPQAPKELADALYFITSAGIDSADAIDVLTASAKASAAGLGETKVVADAVTSAVNAYGIEALSASRATDVLTATVREGKGEADEIAPALGRVIPIAEALGIEFDEVGAAVATMTLTGNSASVSVSALQAAMRTLLRPALSSKDTLADLGLTIDDLRKSVAEDGLFQTMMMLREELGNNKDAISALFPNTRALTFFLQLTGKAAGQNAEIFRELANSTGATETAFQVAAKTARFQLDQALSRLKASLIRIGTVITPVVVALVKGFAAILEGIVNLPGPLKIVIGVFIALAAILGPVLLLIGLTSKALVTMAIGAGTVAPAIIGVITWLKVLVANLVAARFGTMSFSAAILASITPMQAFVIAAVAVVGAIAAINKFQGEQEQRVKTLVGWVNKGTSSYQRQADELARLDAEVGSFEGPFDVFSGTLAVTDNLRDSLAALENQWRKQAVEAGALNNGVGTYIDVMKVADGITKEQGEAIAGLIASHTRFAGRISDTTAAQLENLAAAGDFAGIMKLLRGEINAANPVTESFVGANERLAEAANDSALKQRINAQAIGLSGREAGRYANDWANRHAPQIIGANRRVGAAVVQTARLTQDQIQGIRDAIKGAIGTAVDVIGQYRDKTTVTLKKLREAFRKHTEQTAAINDSWDALVQRGVPQQYLSDLIEGLGPKGARKILSELEGATNRTVTQQVAAWQKDKRATDRLTDSVGNVKTQIDNLPEVKNIDINVQWNQYGDVPPNVGDRVVPPGSGPRPLDLPPAAEGGFVARSGPIFAHANEVIVPLDRVEDFFGGGGGRLVITDDNLGLVMEGVVENNRAHRGKMRRMRRR